MPASSYQRNSQSGSDSESSVSGGGHAFGACVRCICVAAMLSVSGCGQPADLGEVSETSETQLSEMRLPATHGTDERSAATEYRGRIPQFSMLASEHGLRFRRFDDISGRRRITETNGGGAALFDYDSDGVPDVLLTDGSRIPMVAGDVSTPTRLFRTRGQMQFEDRTAVSIGLSSSFDTGCTAGDVNADGFPDVYIAALGPNRLLVNNGDGTFSVPSEAADNPVLKWSASCAFADLNADGILDLYVVNYLEVDMQNPKVCPNPLSPDGYEGCSPAEFDGVDDVLFIGDGCGRLHDRSQQAGITGLRGKGLGVAVDDFDDDGMPDIFVANDGEANHLLMVSGAGRSDSAESVGRYADRGMESGTALSERGYAQAGMGVAVGDYNGDGRSDLFLTHFLNDGNTLYSNQGNGVFRDESRSSGLGAASRAALGFGTVFLDADNNGAPDLFVANGHVDDRRWMIPPQPYAMRAQFFMNREDGTFADVSDLLAVRPEGEYFRRSWLGRGAAAGDIDRDGRMDLVVSHQSNDAVVLHNQTSCDSNSITIQLSGRRSDRSGLLTRLTVVEPKRTSAFRICGGQSFQSSSLYEFHVSTFGRPSIGFRLDWQSGQADIYTDVTSGHYVAVEGRGLIRTVR
ncbi:MAG: VCBS repeat-containing protein [Planctomycetaceae bacterium]|nr:VCBS repeat-containing protein [Planctomycetaceae bacterium]